MTMISDQEPYEQYPPPLDLGWMERVLGQARSCPSWWHDADAASRSLWEVRGALAVLLPAYREAVEELARLRGEYEDLAAFVASLVEPAGLRAVA